MREATKDVGGAAQEVVDGGSLAIYRHVGSGSTGLTRTTAEGRLPLRPDLRSSNGPYAAALAVFMQDLAGCNVYPIAPLVAPTQVDVHIRDGAPGVDELVGTSEMVRQGRSAMVTQARIFASGQPERLVAFGQVTFATLGSTRSQPLDPHRTSITIPAEPPPSLIEWIGAEPLPDGTGYVLVELPHELGEPVTLGGDTDPPLHGGPIQILNEAASWLAAGRRADLALLTMEDFSTAMMASTRRPPFVAVAEVIAEVPGSIDCRVELREDGGRGRVTAVSFARLRVDKGSDAGAH